MQVEYAKCHDIKGSFANNTGCGQLLQHGIDAKDNPSTLIDACTHSDKIDQKRPNKAIKCIFSFIKYTKGQNGLERRYIAWH